MLLKNSSILSVLPNSTASWSMRVIYTSKGVMKMLGCVLYIRCGLSIEKYGILTCRGDLAKIQPAHYHQGHHAYTKYISYMNFY
jgi:hypothetical protein